MIPAGRLVLITTYVVHFLAHGRITLGGSSPAVHLRLVKKLDAIKFLAFEHFKAGPATR